MVGVISFSLYAAGTIALGTAIAITSTVYQLHSAMKMKKKMKAAQAKAAAEADKRKGFKFIKRKINKAITFVVKLFFLNEAFYFHQPTIYSCCRPC